jgi:hypothetical protein
VQTDLSCPVRGQRGRTVSPPQEKAREQGIWLTAWSRGASVGRLELRGKVAQRRELESPYPQRRIRSKLHTPAMPLPSYDEYRKVHTPAMPTPSYDEYRSF